MDRRQFLSGLFGAAGIAAFGGLTVRAAQAAPIAPPLDTSGIKAGAAAEAGRTPDGTGVDKAHYTGWRHRHRGWRRRWRRRHRSRVVCRRRWRYGRRVRVCRRVYW